MNRTLELKIISLADILAEKSSESAEKSADNSVHGGNYLIGINKF